MCVYLAIHSANKISAPVIHPIWPQSPKYKSEQNIVYGMEGLGELNKWFIYLSIFYFCCAGFSLLLMGFLSCGKLGGYSLQPSASHCSGLSCCRVQALGTWAQQLWGTGFVAPKHVESSPARGRICVPCIDRQILNTGPPGKSNKRF